MLQLARPHCARQGSARDDHSPETTTSRPNAALWIGAGAIFAVTFVLRLLRPDMQNEHFLFLAGGRQIWEHGELPVRDFVDPGQFPMFYVSAATLALSGGRLIGELILTLAIVAFVTASAFVLATKVSGSTWIGLIAAALMFGIYPLLYNYYKLVALISPLWLAWRYADRPSTGRLAVLSVSIALGGFARPDLGAYAGLCGLTVVAFSHYRTGFRAVMAQTSLLAALTAVAFLPPLLIFEASGGVGRYLADAANFGVRERGGALFTFPSRDFSIDLSAPVFFLAPVAPPGVTVRWSPDVTPIVRGELERVHGLSDPEKRETPDGRTWRYLWHGPTEERARAFGRDPRIEDTDNVRAALDATYWVRTVPPLRARIAPGILREQNAAPWLFYLIAALPIFAVVRLLYKRRAGLPERLQAETAKIASTAVLSVAATRMMGAPSHSRLADVALPAIVLGAWLLGELLQRSPRRSAIQAGLRGAAAASLVLLTWFSATNVSELGPLLERSSLPFVLEGLDSSLARARAVVEKSSTSPPIDAWAPADSVGLRGITRYLHECTTPNDRVLVPWFEPRIPYYTERAFAGGVPLFHARHFSDPPTQARIIRALEGQQLPIIVVRASAHDVQFAAALTQVHEYIGVRYAQVAELSFGEPPGEMHRVLVDRARSPIRAYGPNSLPCFA